MVLTPPTPSNSNTYTWEILCKKGLHVLYLTGKTLMQYQFTWRPTFPFRSAWWFPSLCISPPLLVNLHPPQTRCEGYDTHICLNVTLIFNHVLCITYLQSYWPSFLLPKTKHYPHQSLHNHSATMTWHSYLIIQPTKIRPLGAPETSTPDYSPTLCNSPGNGRFHSYCRGSLKSRRLNEVWSGTFKFLMTTSAKLFS